MTDKRDSDGRLGYVGWGIVLIIIAVVIGIRVRLLEMPLERDEGEYAYAGQLMLQGLPPYQYVYNMKMPGIYAAYAVIMAVFGQSIWGIHAGVLLADILVAVLIFILAKRLFGTLAAQVAAVTFIVLSSSPLVHGAAGNAELFVILFAMAGILLLLYGENRPKGLKIFLAAVLLGVCFLMKQHGAAFILFGLLYLIITEIKYRNSGYGKIAGRIVLFLAGAVLPFAATCLIFWRLGIFDKFWFWTFKYAREYVSVVTPYEGVQNFTSRLVAIAGGGVFLWGLAAFGIVGLFSGNERIRRHRLFVVAFFAASFLAMSPGLYYRWQYFVLLLPAVSILAGAGVICIRDFFVRVKMNAESRILPVVLVAVFASHSIYVQRQFFFMPDINEICHFIYHLNPFPEAVVIADYIKKHTVESDKIAVIGSEPEIYFYSGRRSATGYIYTYPLMEEQPYAMRMQEEMIREIESANPKYLIFVDVVFSWLPQKGSQKRIMEWFKEYSKGCSLTGVIDIISPQETIYVWDEAVRGYSPVSKYRIYVYRNNR